MSHRSADVDHHDTGPAPTRAPTAPVARRPDRPPSRAERRAETARMVAVLSEALASQMRAERPGETAHMVGVLSRTLATHIDRLVTSTDPAPDGWWFGPDPEVARDAAEH